MGFTNNKQENKHINDTFQRVKSATEGLQNPDAGPTPRDDALIGLGWPSDSSTLKSSLW